MCVLPAPNQNVTVRTEATVTQLHLQGGNITGRQHLTASIKHPHFILCPFSTRLLLHRIACCPDQTLMLGRQCPGVPGDMQPPSLTVPKPLPLISQLCICPEERKIRFFCVCLLSFQGHICGTWRFPGQGSNRSCCCRPTPQPQQRQIRATSATYTTVHGNAGSVTH